MLVSDVLGVPRSLLNDPSKVFWSDPEIISYLNSFTADACGRRRDLFALRVGNYALVAGVYQAFTTPAGASDVTELLECYSANNGPVAFMTDITDLKHSKFAGLANATPVAAVKAVSYEPRDRRGFRVYPPSTGSGSTLDVLLACVPSPVAAMSDTYPLDADTVWAAQWFVIGMALEKNNERRDEPRSAKFLAQYEGWLSGNLQGQLGMAPKADQA